MIWQTTGLEKVSFYSNPKERRCQRMLKLPHNCTQLTRQQSNAPNSPSQASTVREARTSRCSSWIQKGQRNPDIKLPTSTGSWKKQEDSKKKKTHQLCFTDSAKAFDCVDHSKLWEILKDMGIPDHLICLLRNLIQVKKQQLKPNKGLFPN